MKGNISSPLGTFYLAVCTSDVSLCECQTSVLGQPCGEVDRGVAAEYEAAHRCVGYEGTFDRSVCG
jgi:hypothetical protein